MTLYKASNYEDFEDQKSLTVQTKVVKPRADEPQHETSDVEVETA